MSKGKIAAGILAGLFVIYLAAAPYITVHQMKTAAERHDGDALSEHIDYLSVRQGLKDQLNVALAQKMAEDEGMKDNPFAVLGAAFAGVMVDKLVEAYVTPAGITLLMAGEKPKMGAATDDRNGTDSGRKPFSDASMSYETMDKFVVKVKGADGDEGKFVLRRQGFGWKLTNIIVPLADEKSDISEPMADSSNNSEIADAENTQSETTSASVAHQTLCQPDKVIFSCMTKNNKHVDACDSGDQISYFYGKSSSELEMTLWVPRSTASTRQWDGMGRAMSYAVNIPNANTTYSLYWSAIRDPEAQDPISAGIEVIVDGVSKANIECIPDTVQQNIEDIELQPEPQ